jgi:hypothetical protein
VGFLFGFGAGIGLVLVVVKPTRGGQSEGRKSSLNGVVAAAEIGGDLEDGQSLHEHDQLNQLITTDVERLGGSVCRSDGHSHVPSQ